MVALLGRFLPCHVEGAPSSSLLVAGLLAVGGVGPKSATTGVVGATEHHRGPSAEKEEEEEEEPQVGGQTGRAAKHRPEIKLLRER